MSTAKKLTDADTTTEFELPENFRKVAKELKQEQKTVNQEIDKVKAEANTRKTDESTRVFNLRQEQMLDKIKELEDKKETIEKELNIILQQKNSRLHEDLKKVAQVLVFETRKIAPLEKEIESGMSKISNLKNEMQHLFESSVEERKKNSIVIEDQNKEIHQIGSLIHKTLSVFENDFRHITLDVEKLSMEKIDLFGKVTKLNEQISIKESVIKVLEDKQWQLKQLETSISSLEDKLPDLLASQAKLLVIKDEISFFSKQRDELSLWVLNAEQEKVELQNERSRTEQLKQQAHEQLMSKKEMLLSAEKEILEAKKRVEILKSDEFELTRYLQQEQMKLAKIQAETSHFEGMKSAANLLHEESLEHFKEKKEYYNKEIEILSETNKLKILQLDAEFEKKKLQWDQEFNDYTSKKESEFLIKFQADEKQHYDEMRKKKNELIAQVLQVFEGQFNQEGFSSKEQKKDDAKKEITAVMDYFFGKTSKWKIW
jgi:hypothetical protein